MEEYTVRSTYTRAESAARRAADIAVILLLCFFLVFILFEVILVPVEVNDENVAELNTVLLLPDKRPAVSALDRYLIPYGRIYGETRLRVAPLTRLSFFM